MKETTCFGERVIATYKPKKLATSASWKLAAAVLGAASLASLAFAIVLAEVLQVSPNGPLLFGLWTGACAVGCWQGPKLWLEGLRYDVTDKQVVCSRGFYRRSIDRAAISFARIRWSTRFPGFGDLELVRAIATGPLRRRLTLRLVGVAAPDRVWALIRDAEQAASPLRESLPLSQRLDPGERVLWSGKRRHRASDFLPKGKRAATLLALAVTLVCIALVAALEVVYATLSLADLGLETRWVVITLCGHLVTTVAVLCVAAFLFYQAVLRPGLLSRSTRYLVTNQRVLILRRNEELHLDRQHIVDAVDEPRRRGARALVLVLDGLRRPTLATRTAPTPSLIPTLEGVDDIDGLLRALSLRPAPVTQRA